MRNTCMYVHVDTIIRTDYSNQSSFQNLMIYFKNQIFIWYILRKDRIQGDKSFFLKDTKS